MPHSGSATVETRKKMAEIAVKNLVLGLAGRKMVYQVKAQSSH
jgi:glyoxylate reductase